VSISLTFSSALSAPADEVWAVVSTMDRVNHELRPWVRMTYPSTARSLTARDVDPGVVLFRSWLLAFGVIPFDRHALALDAVDDDGGFVEESTSWLQKRWRHERHVEQDGTGSRVTDQLVVEPRIPFAAPLVAAIVRRIFEHRHRRLQRRFGASARQTG
jgi:ligand-binding SRPBCC domain-containing protein